MHLSHAQTGVHKNTIVFVLGPKTNVEYKHAIVPVASENVLNRDTDVAVQPRISLVLRNIHTDIVEQRIGNKKRKNN